jgi:hypothetical protein
MAGIGDRAKTEDRNGIGDKAGIGECDRTGDRASQRESEQHPFVGPK